MKPAFETLVTEQNESAQINKKKTNNPKWMGRFNRIQNYDYSNLLLPIDSISCILSIYKTIETNKQMNEKKTTHF